MNRAFSDRKKTIEIIAGPNGSGKTTFAETFFVQGKRSDIFINPDAIAAGISPTNAELAAFRAGRWVLVSVRDAMGQGRNFAFESTLSGKTWFPILKEAVDLNYGITIYFICLNSARESLQRIRARVKAGGHDIPKEIVLRRYPKTFFNFWNVYRGVCLDWYVFNNSGKQPRLIQSKESFEKLSPEEQTTFSVNFLAGRT